MTKDEMREGFRAGRLLTQEEWSSSEEISAVDELVAEGEAEVVEPWKWRVSYQCTVRKIRGLRKDQRP